MSSNVCQQCGACCAAYRVSFYWGELDEAPGGKVPSTLAEKVNDHMACMRGTDCAPVRCVALGGKVGESVKCHIYEWRPSPCHEMIPGSDGCNRARVRWGLAEIE
ncbi:MAG: YkgJ family cysteine cluster protein [Betaproteobacteria bacterium]|nr:YkgJ family cysteine cluster protein [Betaproteobacteria bacterium]